MPLGPGALLAKVDLENAYSQIPVHPDDRHLLSVRWKDVVYLDRTLPFGLLSVPKMFSAVADALLWIMYRRTITSGIHYLDDFLFLGVANSSECAENLATALRTCNCLGVPVVAKNLERPSSCLVFLELQLNSDVGMIRLPQAKLRRTCPMVSDWYQKYLPMPQYQNSHTTMLQANLYWRSEKQMVSIELLVRPRLYPLTTQRCYR